MIIDKPWLFRVFREEANADGGDTGGGNNTSVQTEEGPESDAGAEGSDANDASEDAGENTGEDGQTNPPETYADFNMPEGVTVDDAALTEATTLFKEIGLTQEQAQTLMDLQAKQAQASSQSQVDDFNQLMQDWQDQSKNDKEFGGDSFDENVKVARAAIDKFGTPELKQLLEEHGVGNHPEVIRFMIKVGRLTSEDVPGSSNTTGGSPQDRVSRMYPNDRNA